MQKEEKQKIPQWTQRQLELAMQYLADNQMPMPKEIKTLSELEMISIQIILENLLVERSENALH